MVQERFISGMWIVSDHAAAKQTISVPSGHSAGAFETSGSFVENLDPTTRHELPRAADFDPKLSAPIDRPGRGRDRI